MATDNTGVAPIHLFQGFGIELEYMVVDRHTLDVRPISDRILFEFAGEQSNFVPRSPIAWSNELVLHVIELKTHGPAPTLADLDLAFHREIGVINKALSQHDACLLSTAMHPWMDPDRESRLWPHDDRTIYHTYDRIFDCHGHGWANLQSMHINLPFFDDREFALLHAAIRLVLPLLPALAASSPFADGRLQAQKDHRLHVYRHNADRLPRITGDVIPEAVYSRADYEQHILQPIYHDLAAVDPAGTLQEEWVNSRGAIARFDRNTIEIRIIDIQECPQADIAIAAFCAAIIRWLTRGDPDTLRARQGFSTTRLARIYQATVADAEAAEIGDEEYAALLGVAAGTAGAVLRSLADRHEINAMLTPRQKATLDTLLREGSLASRLVRHCGPAPDHRALRDTWETVRRCLADNELFS